MTVLRPSNNPNHALSITPRFYVESAVLFIKHKISEDDYQQLDIDCVTDNGYLNFNIEYEVKEEGDYDIYIMSHDSKLIYRGQVYATDSDDLQNYKYE